MLNKTFTNMSGYNREEVWRQSLSASEWESLSVGALPLPPDPITNHIQQISHHVASCSMPTKR